MIYTHLVVPGTLGLLAFTMRQIICYVEVARIRIPDHLQDGTSSPWLPGIKCSCGTAVERLFSKATRVYSKLSKNMDGITLRDVLMSENLSFY